MRNWGKYTTNWKQPHTNKCLKRCIFSILTRCKRMLSHWKRIKMMRENINWIRETWLVDFKCMDWFRQYGFTRAKVAWNFIKGVLRLKWGLTVPVITFVVQSLSRVQLFVTLWMVTRQAFLSFTISWSLLKLISIELVMPSNHLILCHPLLLLPSIFPSIGVFSNVSSSQQVAKILEFQDQSFQWIFRIDFLSDWLVWSPCCPRDTQKPSPTPQFRSTNSLVLSLLYGPTLISIHDYWKNHSFDYMDLCQQSNVSAF